MARQTAFKLDDSTFDIAPFFKADSPLEPSHTTSLGALFSADCMAVLPQIRDEVVDTVFADPPFNLGKEYGKSYDDLQSDNYYLSWCKGWMKECVRTIKPGGAFFLYNLPKWNIFSSDSRGLDQHLPNRIDRKFAAPWGPVAFLHSSWIAAFVSAQCAEPA